MVLIDTHAHIYSEEFHGNLEGVVDESLKNGVSKILMPNVNSHSIASMLQIEQQYPDICYSMMGLHPTYVKENYLEELAVIKEWLFKRSFIAVGEIGIDLYWDKSMLNEQKVAFMQQIEWAKELDLPIVIHARDSFKEIFEVLDECNSPNLRGLFHSFSGGCAEVERVLSYGGFKIAFNGIVTFKNSKLDDSIRSTGIENMVLETDAPYLAPHPLRGSVNKPANVSLIAAKVAEVLNISVDEVAKITTSNARQLFSI
jgi:TatD DNase family protein